MYPAHPYRRSIILAGLAFLLDVTITPAKAADWVTMKIDVEGRPIYTIGQRIEAAHPSEIRVDSAWCGKPDPATRCIGQPIIGEISYQLEISSDGAARVSDLSIHWRNRHGKPDALFVKQSLFTEPFAETTYRNGVRIQFDRHAIMQDHGK